MLADARHLLAAGGRDLVARARPLVVVRVGDLGEHVHPLVEDRRRLQVVAGDARAAHGEHARGLLLEARARERPHHVQDADVLLHDGVRGPQHRLGVRRRDVLGALGDDDLLDVFVAELRQPELAVDGLRGPGRALPHLTHPLLGHRSQGAVHVPVALQHEEVVEVLGVEVGGSEHVVVAQDPAEAREEEVRAGEEEGHGVRRAAHVRLGDEGVVARARLEVAEHDEEVLGEQLAHAAGHGADHAGRVDAAVLHALGAHRPGERDAARLEVEHRLALGGAHERLRAAAARDPHLEAARGVGGAEKGLGPGRVVAVDEGALGAVHGDRLGVGGEAMEGELELHGLLDGALRERPAGADLRADEHGQRVGGRVAVHGHRGLDLAEAEGDRGGGVGGQQQRVVETVGDVRLAGGRTAHAHLGDRHLQLDGAQQRDDARELGGGGAPGEADDVLPGRTRVDDQAGERDVVEGVRLLRPPPRRYRARR